MQIFLISSIAFQEMKKVAAMPSALNMSSFGILLNSSLRAGSPASAAFLIISSLIIITFFIYISVWLFLGLDIFTLFVHNNIFHSLDGHFANPKNNH